MQTYMMMMMMRTGWGCVERTTPHFTSFFASFCWFGCQVLYTRSINPLSHSHTHYPLSPSHTIISLSSLFLTHTHTISHSLISFFLSLKYRLFLSLLSLSLSLSSLFTHSLSSLTRSYCHISFLSTLNFFFEKKQQRRVG